MPYSLRYYCTRYASCRWDLLVTIRLCLALHIDAGGDGAAWKIGKDGDITRPCRRTGLELIRYCRSAVAVGLPRRLDGIGHASGYVINERNAHIRSAGLKNQVPGLPTNPGNG